ncbi:porin family protein [Hymenobacter latericus]|uniref:porin family protein n=1 Tax=Hymenobacter sp. YIM 151858-1 TaxID=2987688 RepID=UPI002226F8B4|nr:porin family protein [Hymenobacter sp. YIM 151858-1]UYZ58795.1 PorT family protein [Hymenobacter sp. YIM 151858-1]
MRCLSVFGSCPAAIRSGLLSFRTSVAALLLILAIEPGTGWAQVSFKAGLRGGANFANAAGPDAARRKVCLAYHGGLVTQLQLGRYWSVGPEVLYSAKGDNTLQYGPSIGAKLDYLEVPLLARYTRDDAFVELGPYAARLLRTRYHDAALRPFALDTYRPLDYGLAVGLGYQDPNGLSLSWRYSAGLPNVYRPVRYDAATTTQVRLRHSVVQFSLGYRFNSFAGLKKIRLNPFRRKAGSAPAKGA